MKNAILISGPAGSGKTLLSKKIAQTVSPERKTWAVCTSVKNMTIRHDTKVVVAEVQKLKKLEQFLPFINEAPIVIDREGEQSFTIEKPLFFIFQSQTIKSLPNEKKWSKRIAELHLTSPSHGIIMFDPYHGNLPSEIVKAIGEELRKNEQIQAFQPIRPVKKRGL